jgi:hypothetical protein
LLPSLGRYLDPELTGEPLELLKDLDCFLQRAEPGAGLAMGVRPF